MSVAIGGPEQYGVQVTWLAAHGRDDIGDPFTFFIALDGRLRSASRCSEHTALAGGREVLAAGSARVTLVGWRLTPA
jgi:hypothetical protein